MKIATPALCAVVLLACASPVPSIADASTFCLYSLLVGAHQMTAHCKDKVDPAQEKRYRDVLTAVRDNIIRNDRRRGATPDKTRASLDAYEVSVAGQYASASDKVCNSTDYPGTRKMLDNLISPKNANALLVNLPKSHDDPFKGDCL